MKIAVYNQTGGMVALLGGELGRVNLPAPYNDSTLFNLVSVADPPSPLCQFDGVTRVWKTPPSKYHEWNGNDWVLAILTARSKLCAEVDAKAEEVRQRFVTGGASQAMVYILKNQQAAAFKAAGYLGIVPSLVQAEATASGKTPQQAADFILLQADACTTAAANVDTIRRSCKFACDALLTLADIQARCQTAISQLEAIRP